MNTEADIKQIQQTRSSLISASCLNPCQLKCIEKVIDLLGETEADRRKQHCPATHSRRKAVHTLLSVIHQWLGIQSVFLCSIALSITRLTKVKNDHHFVSELIKSGLNAHHQTIADLASEHLGSSVSRLPKHDPTLVDSSNTREARKRAPSLDNSPAKRIRVSDQLAKPGYHGIPEVLPTTPHVGERSNGSREDVTDSEDEEYEDSEDSEDEDEPAQIGTGGAHLRGVDEFQNVYKLKKLDVVRVLLSQKKSWGPAWGNRLTMPHLSNFQPFITITVPNTLAMEFLSQRKKITW